MSKESSRHLSRTRHRGKGPFCEPSLRIGDWSFADQVSGVATGSVPASQVPFVQAEAGTIAWGNRRPESRSRPSYLGHARLSG